ncbi:MAG: hypothetical protein HYT65_02480, partial [Candidatus Yanofskybacteria bacterium]|nr:hypothetical protein [Candidatus Yanofskybacteria bacterium]
MKTKLLVVFLSIFVVFVATLPNIAYGQGNVALLFDGMALAGKTNFLKDSGGLNQMKAKSAVFPGAEVRFNQDGRVTIGVGYQRWGLDAEPEHFIIMADTVTGQELAGVTLNREVSMSTLVSTVYINLLTKGRVRPFLGVGGGANFAKTDFRTARFVAPGLNFQFEDTDSWSEKRIIPAIKVGAGVNF